MRIKSWKNKIINRSTLLGLMYYCFFYPRASHGAIIVNAFQAFNYPPAGGLNNNSHGYNPWVISTLHNEPRSGFNP